MKEFFLNLNKRQKIIIIVIMFLIIFIGFIFLYKTFYEEESTQIPTDDEKINNEFNTTEVEEDSKIGLVNQKKKVVVHVIGEVNNPSVVTLDEGSRIIDAINSAGGKTEEADLSKINLAYIVEDGTQIYVPRINETVSSNYNQQNAIQYIREDAGSGIITEGATSSENKEDSKVNINTANSQKLQTLTGIGETTAQKIIEYREKNGKFKTEEELKNVSGIGDSKYNNLKEQITVK